VQRHPIRRPQQRFFSSQAPSSGWKHHYTTIDTSTSQLLKNILVSEGYVSLLQEVAPKTQKLEVLQKIGLNQFSAFFNDISGNPEI
jgi:hypothetical protein